MARIPVIPGFNDSVSSAERMAEVLAGIAVKRVDLLPFHRLGSSKYTALGKHMHIGIRPRCRQNSWNPCLRYFIKEDSRQQKVVKDYIEKLFDDGGR